MTGVASLVLHTHFFPYLQLSMTFPEEGRQESLQILCIKGAFKSPKLPSVPIFYLNLNKVSHWCSGCWEAYHVTLGNQSNWIEGNPTVATFNQHLHVTRFLGILLLINLLPRQHLRMVLISLFYSDIV